MRTASWWSALGIAFLVAGSARAASDFQFQLPPGWVNLVDRSVSTDQIPPLLLTEARSGRYLLYACDPDHVVPVGPNTTMNVVEHPQTGQVTEALLRQTADAMPRQMPSGVTIKIDDTRLVRIGDVNVGRMTSTITGNGQSVRLLQYMIPGKAHVAVITYGCPVDSYERMRPVFEASMARTRGAANHSPVALVVGMVGAIALVLATLLVVRGLPKGTKRSVAFARQGLPRSFWECSTCKRRVPARLVACRCGSLRPA